MESSLESSPTGKCWKFVGIVINTKMIFLIITCDLAYVFLVNYSSSQLSKYLYKCRDRIDFSCNWISCNVVRKVNQRFTFLITLQDIQLQLKSILSLHWYKYFDNWIDDGLTKKTYTSSQVIIRKRIFVLIPSINNSQQKL